MLSPALWHVSFSFENHQGNRFCLHNKPIMTWYMYFVNFQLLRGTTTAEEQDLLQALQMWTNLLFNTNFAVNFLLYCVSGKNFRKSLRNIMLRKCNNKLPNSWTSMSKTKHESIGIPNRIAKGDARPPPRRNYTKEAPENVELEERREAPVYPNNNICSVNRGTIQEVDETISV